ncbi:MAG TPA: tetratricopeptide repeat protein [Terriglobia bacterium]|jgi:tetratricopeptide (TPR) repeat protein|nr:tetratricopeptide repeat protein [Terriglobia bacterium]
MTRSLRNPQYAIGAVALVLLVAGNAAGQELDQRQAGLLRDAGKALTAGNLTLAEIDLQTALRNDPEDYRALNLLGILRAQQRRDSEAERLFKQVIQIKPDFAGGHAGLGLLCLQSGQRDEATAEFQQALRLDPARADIRDKLVGLLREDAREALRADNPEKALASLLQARKLNPDDPDLQYELGMVALRMSLFTDSAEAFQNVLAKRPDDSLALYGLGRAQIEAGKFPEAKESFTRYVHDHSEDPSGHYALGLVLEVLQEDREAQSHFERSIALRPAQTESYFRLGVIELDHEQWDGAKKNFRIVLDRDNNHAGALAGLGRIAYQEKSYPEAADLLQRAVASDPTLREAHYFLGLAYARIGRKQESERELQIATRLEHQELERRQQGLKIIGLDDGPGSGTPSPQ